MRGDRKVQRFVEARRDLAALRRQLRDYPELSASAKFLANLRTATVAADAAVRCLTGGQLARARAVLANSATMAEGRP